MVLESIVSSLLEKFLGDYIDGLSTQNLRLGIFSGDVVLQNLAIKTSALSDLELPIRVKSGTVGKITLKIPWKSLGNSPTVISIEKVFLVAGPTPFSEYTVEADEKRAQATKQRRLQLAELLSGDDDDEDEKKKKEKY